MRPLYDVDKLAPVLRNWGQLGRAMPRGSWEAEQQSHPVVTSLGHNIGTIVPGYGLVLDGDLKDLGINRAIPGVIERSPFCRFIESISDENGAITSLSDIHTEFKSRGQYADAFTTYGPGLTTAWVHNYGAANFTTAPGSAPTRTSAAAYSKNFLDPPNGKNKYLLGLSVSSTAGGSSPGWGMAIIVDVLVEAMVDLGTTSAVTINSTALTRYTSGVGVFASFWVVNAVLFGSACTATVVYTNQSGTGSRSTSYPCETTDGPEAMDSFGSDGGSMPILRLQDGDYGVRSVQSIQVSVASSSSGNNDVALILYHPVLFVQAITDANTVVERDVRSEPYLLKELAVTAGGTLGCLNSFWNSAGANGTTNIQYTFLLVDG